MKPASFEYYSPASVDEALGLLQAHRPDARVLAGGQSLVPMMNFRLATPSVLVDLNRIAELAYVRDEGAAISIGAMTRQRAIEFSPVIAEKLPLLMEAIRLVGHLPTRSRGTIGGSIANADPAAEMPMVLQALDGLVTVRGPKGERTIAAADLFVDAMTTSIAADEILVQVRLPVMAAGSGFAVEEFARRHGDFAIAAIAVVIERKGSGCSKARLATAGVSSHSTRLREAEHVLEREGLGDDAIAKAAGIASETLKPMSDQNASADYRRQLTRVLTERAVRRAMAA